MLFRCALFFSIFIFVRASLINTFKIPRVSQYKYETKFMDTYVDHFNYLNDDKFKIRYLINEDKFRVNSSILFYTGNEGDVTLFAENTGFIWEAAEILHSTVIFIEHRYYGKSMPFGEDSFDDRTKFGYLTAEQALSDFALVITELKKSDKYKNVPVIAMGGSYGGMLTAWMRQKYPNIVVGGLAASAPVFGFPGMRDCDEFSKIATNAYAKTGSETCPDRVRKAWKSIIEMGKDKSGLDKLTKIFNVCNPLTDSMSLISYISDFVGSLAMVNYPYPTNFLFDIPDWPLRKYCQILDRVDIGTELERFSSAFWSLFDGKKTQNCLDLTGKNSSGLDVKGWFLQTCMEMTIPMCSNGIDDMFPLNSWSDQAFSDECYKTFGVRPRLHRAEMEWWGEKALDSLEKIIFSNGDLDPWSGLGVNSTMKLKNAFYFRLPNGAHHLDLRASNVKDPEDVIRARKTYISIFKMWIAKHYDSFN